MDVTVYDSVIARTGRIPVY